MSALEKGEKRHISLPILDFGYIADNIPRAYLDSEMKTWIIYNAEKDIRYYMNFLLSAPAPKIEYWFVRWFCNWLQNNQAQPIH